MPRLPDTWTLPQRRVLIGIGAGLAIYILVAALLNPMTVTDPQPLEPSRANELADRIDPNEADMATLAALPMIGEKRARDIIGYRERVRARGHATIAFRSEDDLLKIRGIGSGMLSTIRPYLIFPTTSPSTKPGDTSN